MVAVTARPMAKTPSTTSAMPKARNHPQYWMMSFGIWTSKF